MQLEFKDEMLVPTTNGEMYFKIYEVENWLRRICLTAYMKKYGSNWMRNIPSNLVNTHIPQFNLKKNRIVHRLDRVKKGSVDARVADARRSIA